MTARRRNKAAARPQPQNVIPRVNRGIKARPEDPDYRRFQRWHWGIEPKQVVEWIDPALPERMIEIGRLVELHVEMAPGRAPLKIRIPPAHVETCHLAFDPSHKHERIYILLDGEVQEAVKRKIAESDPVASRPARALADIARDDRLYRDSPVPRRHHTADYPAISVRPVGPLTHVVYRTHKKGDGLSEYIHEMGEEGGIPPILCVSADGRLWMAGGTYCCMIAGIAY